MIERKGVQSLDISAQILVFNQFVVVILIRQIQDLIRIVIFTCEMVIVGAYCEIKI